MALVNGAFAQRAETEADEFCDLDDRSSNAIDNNVNGSGDEVVNLSGGISPIVEDSPVRGSRLLASQDSGGDVSDCESPRSESISRASEQGTPSRQSFSPLLDPVSSSDDERMHSCRNYEARFLTDANNLRGRKRARRPVDRGPCITMSFSDDD